MPVKPVQFRREALNRKIPVGENPRADLDLVSFRVGADQFEVRRRPGFDVCIRQPLADGLRSCFNSATLAWKSSSSFW